MRKETEQPVSTYRVVILRFILLAFFLAIGFKLTVGEYGFLNMVELRKQITELKAEELKLTAQVVDLELKRDRLISDSLYIEKIARKNFQLKRPGETVIEF